MTLWLRFKMFIVLAPAPPTAFMPLPALLLMVLFEISTLTAPLVESLFTPPPALPAMVTRSNVAVTLPPAAGLINTPAPLFDIRLLVTTRFNAPVGSMSSAMPSIFSKTQFSRISVPLPVTLIAGYPPSCPLMARLRIFTVELPLIRKIGSFGVVAFNTPVQSIVITLLLPNPISFALMLGKLRQAISPVCPPHTPLAPGIVAQGSAAVHGLASLPVLDTYPTTAANSGATCKKAVRATVTAKSFALSLIMYRPYDVTSKWKRHHCATEAKSRQCQCRQSSGGVLGGK